jgi:hypothetical protein
VPPELNALDLTTVGAQLGAAQSTSGQVIVQIARGRFTGGGGARTWSDMLGPTNLLDIDQDEWDSKDAGTAADINTSFDDVATGDLIRVDIDSVGTGSQGLFVSLGFS